MTKKSKKTFLITGATGYLGSRLTRALVQKKDCNIIVLKRSSSNTFRIEDLLGKIKTYDADVAKIADIFARNKIDTIIHCATDYGKKGTNPMEVIEANLLLPLQLLELGKNHGVRCFINTDTILDKRVNHYSLSKKHFTDWLRDQRHALVCMNISLEHFYGPGDDTTKFVSFVVESLLKKASSIDLTLGEQKRNFIFIDDVVNAFLKIIDYSSSLPNDFYEFDIGSKEAITIEKFVCMIKRLSKNKDTVLNFGALPYRENEIMECVLDLRPIEKLGWQQLHSLEGGLKLMIEQESNHTKK